MGAGFAYQNLGILHYSRRHVIGDLRRPASAQPITSKLLRCDWLGRIRLITTQAVRHLESYSFGSDGGFTFRAVWFASKVSRYLSILCLWSHTTANHSTSTHLQEQRLFNMWLLNSLPFMWLPFTSNESFVSNVDNTFGNSSKHLQQSNIWITHFLSSIQSTILRTH